MREDEEKEEDVDEGVGKTRRASDGGWRRRDGRHNPSDRRELKESICVLDRGTR